MIFQRATRRTSERGDTRSPHRREAGSSATELLVLTAPLCVLSLVLTSKLAATSSVRLRAGAQASLVTQQAATRPCGHNVALTSPVVLAPALGAVVSSPPTAAKLAALQALSSIGPVSQILSEAQPLLQTSPTALPPDLRTSPELLATNWATRSASATVVPYHFQSQADALIPGPDTLTASATFLCNEPDGGDQVRELKRQQLLTLSIFEATGIFP